MDFNYSETQRMLVEAAERFIAETYTLERLSEQHTIPGGLNVQNWKLFAELGWLALPLPESAGGLGGSFEDIVVLSTMLGRGLAVEPYTSTVVIGAHMLTAIADAPTRNGLLAQIATGEVRLALAHAEPGNRYDIDGRRTCSAEQSGDRVILNGRKMLVVDAPSATHLIVSATENGTLSLYLVPAASPGVTLESYPLIDGAAAADIVLENVALGSRDLLSAGAKAEALLAEAVDRGAVALMGQAVGSMEACLEVCSAYIKQRVQFGQPIGRFQSLQHIMADMFVATHQGRSALYYALANIEAEADRRSHAVSSAKLTVGEASQLVSRSGIQLHGGYGVTDEFIISHHFRRLMSLEKQFGDIDFHSRRLADYVLGASAT